jgi:DNA-binding SARP family transcriptional activator
MMMDLANTFKLNRERLVAQIAPYSLVLLSPRLRYRNMCLAQLVNADTYLYTLQQGETTLTPFLRGLSGQLDAAEPGSGQALRQALGRRHAPPKTLADALLTGLAKIGPRCLVLDSFEYLTLDEEVRAFLQCLLHGLPSGLKVVLNARVLPHRFWSFFVQSGQAIFLGADLDRDCLTPRQSGQAHLEVYALSRGEVYVDGLPVGDWDGPLPRNLFYFLVDRPSVTRDEIFETFWPSLSTKEATNVFHVTKRKITACLGHELTAYRSGFYHHAEDVHLHYDVASFEHSLSAGEHMTPEQALPAWQRAVRLYRVPFLYTLDMPWIRQRRHHLSQAYAAILIQIGRWHEAQADDTLAISFLLRAQRESPEREDVCRNLMALCHRRGETAKAAEHYRMLKERLEKRLGITPSKPTRALYQEIVQSQ